MRDKAGTAYPFKQLDHDGNVYFQHHGLTKREYFAAMAMQGILASDVDCPECSQRFEKCTEYAVKHADALIVALEAGGEG